MKRSLILTAFSFLMLAQLAWAQAPQTISYQGVLKDNDGNIVADGNYDLTFRLYDASTGGTEWWSETHTGVPVADGIFNVILGSINSFISTDPRTKFEIPYWLEIAVGASTLSPRIELTAVPYSITARSVQGYMNVFPSNGNVGIGTTTPGSKLHIQSPNLDGIVLTDSTTGAYRATLLNRVTYGGQLNLNDAADGAVKAVIRGYATVDGWQASFTAGNVGIGTDRPEANLQVVGNWTLGSPEFQSPPGGFDSWLSANNGILYEGGGADYTHHFSAYGGGDIARFGISTGVGVAPDTRVVITNSGSVGIGTTSPTNRLHINSASSTVNNLQITNSSSGSSGTDGLKIGFVGSNNANVWNNENSGLVFGTNNLEQMRILNTGNVGIGTDNPSAKLDVAGDANIQGNLVALGDVSTQGTLTALGDANIGGAITIPATTRYYSISPAAFNPSDNSTGFVRSYETIYSTMATGPAVFYAPANLPHGAVIKEMVAAFIYNEATQPIVFDLYRMSLNSTGSDIIARCVSIGSSTAIQTVTKSATTTVATVDNSSYTYVIHTYWTAPTIATDITVRSVKIVYEVTTPLP